MRARRLSSERITVQGAATVSVASKVSRIAVV